MKIVLVCLLSYLLGSIPTGYVFTSLIKKVDLRDFGSGNVGATNAARVLGLKYGIIVALLDIFKGYFAVWIAQIILPSDSSFIVLLIGFLAIIGHDWSVFLKFSGGKGVATTVGVILRTLPVGFIFFAITWFLIIFLTNYVSLGSILGAITLPISAYFLNLDSYHIYFTLILALFVIYTHRSNIKRLINGEENKMSFSSAGKSGN